MTTNTDAGAGQQPNPAAAAGDATGTANPTAQTGTVPAVAQGQGDGGDNAGGDASKTGDGAPAGDGAPGDKPDDTAPKDGTGAPEAYEDFKLPEGVVLDGERKDSALALFRDLGLNQDQAQKAIDQFVKTMGDDDAARVAAVEAAVEHQREEWGKAAKAELGANYDAEVGFARTAVLATQNPKLQEAFDQLGWGNHPELIKAFAFFGRTLRDSPVDGIGSSGGAPVKAKPWDVVYPDMK